MIKDRIKGELGFTVNVGISSNKLLAKMASDFEKPDKVHTLFPEEIEAKMWPLPVGELFLCGKSSADKLTRLHIDTKHVAALGFSAGGHLCGTLGTLYDAPEVADIASRGKLPVIAGGTGLYVDSLLSGREFSESPGDSGLREKLNLEYGELGGEKMLEKLASVDPERAGKLSPNDRKRIVRALEIYSLTGMTITEHDEQSKLSPKPYRVFKVFLNSEDRKVLYSRIDERVDLMFEEGLLNEVKALLDEGVSPGCTSMQAIGYKETSLALAGKCSLEEAKDAIKQGSRRYAKRQLTWFNRYTDAFRLDLGESPDPAEAADTLCDMYEMLVPE